MASPEYERYYEIVGAIPPGRVMTYGDVAFHAGRKRHARRVGYALFALIDGKVPWWRVINARGEISPRAREGRPDETQRNILESEGVEFSLAGRIDLDRYRHRPGVAALEGEFGDFN